MMQFPSSRLADVNSSTLSKKRVKHRNMDEALNAVNSSASVGTTVTKGSVVK